MDMQISIFTDGACTKNGLGGWAYKLEDSPPIGGSVSDTTSNRMEIMGVLEGLKSLKSPSNIVVYTDSRYVIGQASRKWKRNFNRDLLAELDSAIDFHKGVKFQWVSRNTNPHQAACDEIAKNMSRIDLDAK